MWALLGKPSSHDGGVMVLAGGCLYECSCVLRWSHAMCQLHGVQQVQQCGPVQIHMLITLTVDGWCVLLPVPLAA
jgi:hypothetical protein